MLLTDSDIISQADFSVVDSEVVGVAANTKPAITIEGSGSVCELTWAECQQRILSAMQTYTSFPAQAGMAAHQTAINSIGGYARTQPRIRVNQIVTNDTGYSVSQSCIKTWMLYQGLANLYRDAAMRMEKDRYEKRYELYRERALNMWRTLRTSGLPIVYQPLECPGAKHGFNAGTWSAANLSGTGVGINLAQLVYVAVTYYDSSKYVSQTNKGNAESGPSAIVAFTIPLNKLLTVDITSLNPPTGVADPVGLALGIGTPLNATHWNVWVGSSASAMYLQHEGVPIATKTYTLAAAPVLSGTLLAQGQAQDSNLHMQNVVMRA